MTYTLEQLKELCEKATPGPWKYDYGNWQVESEHKEFYRNVVADWCGWDERNEISKNSSIDPINDFEFIAASRTAVPELIHRLEVTERLLKSEGSNETRS